MVIKTDLHTHTNVSAHAYSTLLENAKYAAETGMEAIAMTNHAPGIPDGAYAGHFYNIGVLPETICNVRVFRGAECSFLDGSGKLDLPESALKKLDIVIASVHTPAYCPKTSEEHTEMLLSAMDNEYIDILGHIGRVSCGADFDAVALAAAKKGKVIELNECTLSHSREDETEHARALMEACKKYGTMVSVDSDAHYCELIGHFDRAVKLLNDIGFDEELVINTSLKRFEKYLESKNKF